MLLCIFTVTWVFSDIAYVYYKNKTRVQASEKNFKWHEVIDFGHYELNFMMLDFFIQEMPTLFIFFMMAAGTDYTADSAIDEKGVQT
jgi:hypothetical protein